MKTAVQQLMEDLRKNQDFSIFNNHHINHYLEIERKQMADAFYAPANEAEPKNFYEYYKQKYDDDNRM